MMRNLQSVLAFMLADLLVFKIKAIYPKVCPCVSVLIVFPSIYTSTSPLSIKKKQFPWSSCWNTYSPFLVCAGTSKLAMSLSY